MLLFLCLCVRGLSASRRLVDFPVEHKLGRAGEVNIGEATVGLFENDIEFVAALDADLDRRTEMMNAGGDESGGSYACAAGERLAFDPAFEGPDANAAGARTWTKLTLVPRGPKCG